MPIFGLNAERATIILGFGLTVLSVLLTQYYLEPAQRERSDVQERLSAARTKVKILSAANAMNNTFGQLGSLVFTLNSRDQPDAASEEAVGTLQLRAMDWRHDGVRTYLAQLGVAGQIDYQPASTTYERLVDDELRLGTIEAYRKANAFEGDLSMQAVKDSGAAAMEAIVLHSKFFALEDFVQHRKLILMIVTLFGSTFILVATLIAMSDKPRVPITPGEGRDEEVAGAIPALEAAMAEVRRRIAERGGNS